MALEWIHVDFAAACTENFYCRCSYADQPAVIELEVSRSVSVSLSIYGSVIRRNRYTRYVYIDSGECSSGTPGANAIFVTTEWGRDAVTADSGILGAQWNSIHVIFRQFPFALVHKVDEWLRCFESSLWKTTSQLSQNFITSHDILYTMSSLIDNSALQINNVTKRNSTTAWNYSQSKIHEQSIFRISWKIMKSFSTMNKLGQEIYVFQVFLRSSVITSFRSKFQWKLCFFIIGKVERRLFLNNFDWICSIFNWVWFWLNRFLYFDLVYNFDCIFSSRRGTGS